MSLSLFVYLDDLHLCLFIFLSIPSIHLSHYIQLYNSSALLAFADVIVSTDVTGDGQESKKEVRICIHHDHSLSYLSIFLYSCLSISLYNDSAVFCVSGRLYLYLSISMMMICVYLSSYIFHLSICLYIDNYTTIRHCWRLRNVIISTDVTGDGQESKKAVRSDLIVSSCIASSISNIYISDLIVSSCIASSISNMYISIYLCICLSICVYISLFI